MGPEHGIRTRIYRDGKLLRENFPVDQISDELENRHGAAIWLDLCEPTQEQLGIIGREFGLHALALEDALEATQRTKIDRYQTHLFMSAYSAELNDETGELTSHEISAFITHHALITVRKSKDFDIEPVVARWDTSADLCEHGVSFLLYALLDYLVDGHFRAVEALDEAVEDTTDLLFDHRRGAIEHVQRRSFQLRKSLVVLRRITLPTREVLNTLLRHDLDIVREPMVPYFHDVYDHVMRATEWTESLRDLVTTIVETNLTEQGNRMNMIMKKVTSWAAIIAVPTAI
ncbi:MAG: magnesium transporter CorA family protein, partial [Acidimicrobiaceae bacterium]|nr:magnesium transporter CorA family protein [Acidimicrobiaceae bacterium]